MHYLYTVYISGVTVLAIPQEKLINALNISN